MALVLERQGRRLLQLGVALFLFASFEGFAIPQLAAPRLGSLRTHLGLKPSWIAFAFLIYSGLAIVLAYLLGAIWGAGNTTMHLAAGTAHGTALQEAAIRIIAYSSAPTGIIAFALILWGLRRLPAS